jgi:hypothetical protein
VSAIEVRCPSCKTEARFEGIVPFRAECEKCAADLHVCITCRFYDRYVENECREDQADPVANKDRRNLCEYWRPLDIGGGGVDDEAARAKAKLAAAFGLQTPSAAPQSPNAASPASAPSAADEAKRKLEELFKKK